VADLWYAIIAGMLTAYVLLDGYDFGAGMLHRWVARTDAERRRVLAAIGPFWDGNEVWLLAAGGALFMAFPAVLSAGLSGFYFAIFLVIWCLIGRGLAIELRSHVADPLWRSFWDTVLVGTSLLLALFFGVALANIVRGVPLSADGWSRTSAPARPWESSTGTPSPSACSRAARWPCTARHSSPCAPTASCASGPAESCA
jgi:cytochrome d ubiquinol oxidase subunit II